MDVIVKFWGTRGSIPTPSSWTRIYGGNTSCVEVRFGEQIFVCDAGSGIRELGKDLVARKVDDIHLLITHTHWDHIQGFPFFAPAYMPKTRIRVYGESAHDDTLYQLLSGQMTSNYFPVSFADLGSQVIFDHLAGGNRVVEGVRIRTFPLRHPGGCRGYALEAAGRKIVYATDNELPIHPDSVFPDPEGTSPRRRSPEDLVEICRGADLLIMDAQYTELEYATKKGWGHSSCLSVTDLAVEAGVQHLALFHHDPESTDTDIEQRTALCNRRVARLGGTPLVFGAREGVELKFRPELERALTGPESMDSGDRTVFQRREA